MGLVTVRHEGHRTDGDGRRGAERQRRAPEGASATVAVQGGDGGSDRDPGGLRIGLSPLSTSFSEVEAGLSAALVAELAVDAGVLAGAAFLAGAFVVFFVMAAW